MAVKQNPKRRIHEHMCGIIGYTGERQAQAILLEGLARLEYRGYDSAGIAVIDNARIRTVKRRGKLSVLKSAVSKRPLTGTAGIAHTRWATHGAPNEMNAHPHSDCSGDITLVHNGIIENYAALKEKLIAEGHAFKSETDTEVIVHLIEKFYKKPLDLEGAMRKALKLLTGSFAVAAVSRREPGRIVGARLGSPLIVGVGRGENFLASDVPAVLSSTKDVIFLGENEMAVIAKDGYAITDLKGNAVSRKPSRITWDIAQAEKQSYEHFMLKEINEQPGIL